MKLKKMTIENLHGHYNYEVNFNRDITILFGLNGSGKTTILNILDIVLSGKIAKLQNYIFKEICIYYGDEDSNKLLKVTDNGTTYIFQDDDKSHRLNKFFIDSEVHMAKFLEQRFYNKYSFLGELPNKLPSIYLPVDRHVKLVDHYDDLLLESNVETDSVIKVSKILHKVIVSISVEIAKINDDFRNRVLKLISLKFKSRYNESFEIFNDKEIAEKKIKHIKEGCLRILREFNLLDNIEEKEFISFFDNTLYKLQTMKRFLKREIEFNDRDDLEYFANLISDVSEIYRLEDIVKIADRIESKKEEVRRPLSIFVDIVNDFFGKGNDLKKIAIDDNNNVYMTNQYKENVCLQDLSSGEKQIIILFTYLLFILDKNKEFIFIVDEPELSLHLLWQRIYIKKIKEAAPNVQIIFATHSPEIVSIHSDKMFKLVREKAEMVVGV